jgi:serine O-acetyltransferase
VGDQTFAQRLDSAFVGCNTPSSLRELADDWLKLVLATLFPHFDHPDIRSLTGARRLMVVEIRLAELVMAAGHEPHDARVTAEAWMAQLPQIHDALLQDAKATERFDPAAESVDEVILAYPGFYAIASYRIAHQLALLKVPLVPRLITEHAHRATGIDIHPAATIGVPFVIDHGTGIVIGQTSTIGRDVKLYQSVTLGALAVKKEMASTKRHPTLEDGVIVYAGATILGGDTVIGARTIVGGNAWITRSVPPDSVVTRDTDVRPRHSSEELIHDFGAYI